MKKSKTHYLGKSREVLQLNDVEKLNKLLVEQQAELMKIRVKMSPFGQTQANYDKKLTGQTKLIKKNIARIKTRLTQLKLKLK